MQNDAYIRILQRYVELYIILSYSLPIFNYFIIRELDYLSTGCKRYDKVTILT